MGSVLIAGTGSRPAPAQARKPPSRGKLDVVTGTTTGMESSLGDGKVVHVDADGDHLLETLQISPPSLEGRAVTLTGGDDATATGHFKVQHP